MNRPSLTSWRTSVLLFALGCAMARTTSSWRSFGWDLRDSLSADHGESLVEQESRQWAEFRERHALGRGPIGLIDDATNDRPTEWSHARAAYGLSPTIVVPGRHPNGTIVRGPNGPSFLPGDRP